jgi:transcriptional regulator with XRE-family HTH domain
MGATINRMPAVTDYATFEDWLAEQLRDPETRAAWYADAVPRAVALALIRHRARSGATQTELGRDLGMTQAQVSRLECAEHVPSLETLQRLCDALDLEIDLSIRAQSDERRPAPRGRRDAIVETTDRLVIAIRPARDRGLSRGRCGAPDGTRGSLGARDVRSRADPVRLRHPGAAPLAGRPPDAAGVDLLPHAAFALELSALRRSDPREARAVDHAIVVLATHAGRVGHPWSSAVRGTGGVPIRELRPRAGRSRVRVLYVLAGDAVELLALGPEATADQRGFARAVERATRRLHDDRRETS